MTQLTITPTEDPPGLRLAGEVDMATVAQLKGALAEALTPGIPLTIDMSEVRFIDSTGLHVLVSAAQGANGDNGARKITLRHPSPQVMRVVEIIGIGSLFTIEPTEEPEA